jgi:hypothetical protein
MLRKSFSFVVVGAVLFLLAVFIAAGASQVQAQSAGQLQYWVTMEKDLASVRAQQGDFKEGPAALFERQAATGRWQQLEQAGGEGSAAPAPRTFGYAVAIDGDYAVVGAQWHDGFKGAAYIFERKGDGWTEVQKLSPPDLGRFDHFGSTVSISGDYAVVAATWHDLLRGAVYVFKREGREWVQQDKLTASDARTDDRFGRTVRIDGSDITISDASAGLQDAGMGLAYRFRRSGDAWVEGQKIALPLLEKSGEYAGELLIESETGKDLLALAEIIGKDTETPPLLAPAATEQYFIRGDIVPDGIVDWVDGEYLWQIVEYGDPVSCEDAADVNDDGAIDTLDWYYFLEFLPDEGPPGPPPMPPYPRCGPDPTDDDTLDCAEYTAPCFIVTATDDAFEDRVEIVWTNFGLDAIVYKIFRNNTLISLASSDDSVYADKTGEPGVTYNYCVMVTNMASDLADSACDSGRRIIFPPDNVQASDGDFDQFVRVIWDDMSSVEAGYWIRRGGVWIDTILPPNTVAFDDTGAEQGPAYTYYYEVIAFDADMDTSAPAGDEGWRGFILPPLDVSASDGEYVDTVRITWIDQAENEAGYNIYRNDYGLIFQTDPDVQSYDDVTADSGVWYEYCVKTREDSGESIEVCDSGGIWILPAPGYVIASDTTYDDCIEITWDDPSDLEDGFWILRDGQKLDSTEANASFYKDFSAEPATEYRYCVYAFTEDGGTSDTVCDFGYRAIVLAPFNVQASDGTREDRVEVTWECNSTNAVLFKIFREETFIKSVSQGSRSYSDYGGRAGQDYEYKIVAVTLQEEEEFVSDTASDTGRRELKAPTPVTATYEEHEDKIVVSWVDNSWFEEGYVLMRVDSVTQSGEVVAKIAANRTSLTDYDAKPGVTYEYQVEAFDTVGGEPSGLSAPGTDYGRRVLLPPTNVRASDAEFEKRVEITWDDNSAAEDGYHIYRGPEYEHIGSTTDNFNSYVDTSPFFGQTSLYTVAAFDSRGESESASDNGSTTILAPGSFNASEVYEDRVVLTWVDLSQVEEGYIISRDGDSIATTGPNVTSWSDTTAEQGVKYEYCIRAVCNGLSTAEWLATATGSTIWALPSRSTATWPSLVPRSTTTRMARMPVRPTSSPTEPTAGGPRPRRSGRTTAKRATSLALPWRSTGTWPLWEPPGQTTGQA